VSFFPSTWWNSDPVGKHMNALLEQAKAEGIPVRVTSTRRTREEQERLYAQGRTDPGPIVTWTLNSAHVSGRAFDLTIPGAAEYEDDPDAWELLGELGEALGLEWGGTYGDFGHFELPR
jgi:peptidoglycan L-alanyl-D-glutamate endopeptidase CwlK